jgi:hypothetical protein
MNRFLFFLLFFGFARAEEKKPNPKYDPATDLWSGKK